MEPVRREVSAGDGTVVSYLVFAGPGRPVVILHGLAGSGREFERTARALAGHTVILVDQRGHGFSTRLPADTSRGAFVDDVVRVIEAESSGPVHLVGQSMGAHTAMLVASARPDLVRSLVLLEGNEGSGSHKDNRAMAEYFAGWAVPFPSRDAARTTLGSGPLATAWVADLEERADGFYPRFDPSIMLDTITDVAVPRWREWAKVTAPTLVLYADGGMFTEEQKTRFVAHRPHVSRINLLDATHDAHLDAFDQWIAALTGFLDAEDRINAAH